MDNYEETKIFFKELFKDEDILKSIKNTTIVPEYPPEWLYTFAEFNPSQISKDEMKIALIKMEIPQFDETNWPSVDDYAYIFPINPNEKVKIYYFKEN